jgi:hypothetical protein
MLWLITGDSSHEIVACNTHFKDGMHQIWVERTNGKTLMVKESRDKTVVDEIKDAIDFAISKGHKTLNLN